MKKSMMITLLTILALVLLFCVVYVVKVGSVKKQFTYSNEVVSNPLMGYAPAATEETVTDDVTLLYVDITWRELESQEGVYNWDDIESENQFDRWRSEGKHLVLRFILDYPSNEKHKDIPDWLYNRLDDSGDWYDSEYGKGFSPNYESKVLIAAYEKAVQAMGERWGDDEFISFIELGGLGHWGEWHVDSTAGIRQLPDESVREQYVTPVSVPYVIKGRRAGDIATCYADASKAEEELGWTAQKTLQDMMRDSWRWQSQNPNGYQA